MFSFIGLRKHFTEHYVNNTLERGYKAPHYK